MALESAQFINGLVSTNPTGGDDRSTADDHLRLIKAAILNTFTGITGAVSVTHTELNHLSGIASNVQGQLDAGSAQLASVSFVLYNYIVGVESTVILNSAKATSLQFAVASLDARITSASAAFTTKDNAFSASLAAISASLSAINTSIDSISAQQVTHSAIIVLNTANITSNASKLTSLSTLFNAKDVSQSAQLTSLNARATSLNARVVSMSAQLTSADARITSLNTALSGKGIRAFSRIGSAGTQSHQVNLTVTFTGVSSYKFTFGSAMPTLGYMVNVQMTGGNGSSFLNTRTAGGFDLFTVNTGGTGSPKDFWISVSLPS